MVALRPDRDGANLAPRDQIVTYARRVLAEFAATDVWAPAAQLRAASAHTANEYAGRFLLELLQNAHDTHPADRHDGRITIIVDADEGAHGVVYVANFGAPFTYQSMTGLCKLARSPKQVGQGIGHKGVGFRSILPVCTWPEIYSADPTGPPGNLDGYTFRFARHGDLLSLADGDEELARRFDAEFPPFQLPVPADTIPQAARDLAAAGHVTVIRLPLDTPEACAEALTQAENLVVSDVPVLLFLERIASLTVASRDGGDFTETTLTRSNHPLNALASPEVSFTHVDLGDLGDYTIASLPVAEARLRKAVQDARHANRMSADWEAWDDAVVSLAVPTEDCVVGRMFTFLPMGDKALSPFAGHLNAPFFTKIDRADLDPGHPLNDLLLDVAAEAALTAAATLRASGIEAARRWVSDLVCWDGPHRQRLDEAADRSGDGSLAERLFVPIEVTAGHDCGWASLAETYHWPARNPKVLTAKRAAETGTCLLDSTLGLDRVDRWVDIASWLECPLTPEPDTLAELVEQIVASLDRPSAYEDNGELSSIRRTRKPEGKKLPRPRRKATDVARAASWAGAYTDLATMFATEDTEALRGRQLLVDDAGELRPANIVPPEPGERSGAWRVSAFLPPVRDDTLAVVPASLRRHLFYLHPAIAEQLDPAGRDFLAKANLVYSYDMHNLLDHVGAVVAHTRNGRTHRDALRFVFTLDQNGQVPPRYPITQLRLRVPTSSGALVRASSAVFGPGWPGNNGTDGADLTVVIKDAADLDHALAELDHRLVDPIPDLVRPTDSVSAWAAFLAKIRVQSGLPVYSTSAPTPKLWGDYLRGPELAKRVRLPDRIAEQWTTLLATQPPRQIAHPQTDYVVSRKPVWAVGQDIAEQLTDSARNAYARLILRGLSRWPQDYLAVSWERNRQYGNRDRQTIPTPLAAFLATAAWLPATPGPGRPTFARPDQLWHFPLSSDDAEPSFAPLLNRATRVFLDANPTVLRALKAAGLGVWSDPAHAARLVRDLGTAAATGVVSDNQRDQFLRAYLRAWSTVATRPESIRTAATALRLVLREGTSLCVRTLAELAADNVTVYLARPGDGLHLRLLDELELPLLLVDADLDELRSVLSDELGDHIHIADESAVTVTPTGVTEPGEPLVDQLRWVAVLVAAAADHGRGLTLQEHDFDDLARCLRRLRIQTYTTLGLSLFDQRTALPATNHGLFAEPDDTDPVILSPTAVAELSGPALVPSSAHGSGWVDRVGRGPV